MAKNDNSKLNWLSSTSTRFSISVSLLLVLAMCSFWLISSTIMQNLLHRQAESLGISLSQQTAIQMTEFVLANDMVSMNVVLASLIRDSGVRELAVLNVDGDIIAVAENTENPLSPIIPIPYTLRDDLKIFRAPILLADSTAGLVRLTLNLNYIEVGMIDNLLLVALATIVLIFVGAALTTTYFRYLIVFPLNLLAYSISSIRKGNIETCAVPNEANEISQLVSQYNTTAKFLSQNTFLDRLNYAKHKSDQIDYQSLPSTTANLEFSLLCIRLANFEYLSSTRHETEIKLLLNKFYFYTSQIAELYSSDVSYCHEGETLLFFNEKMTCEEQAFYALCAGQLFQMLIPAVCSSSSSVDETEKAEKIAAKFTLGAHTSSEILRFYSPFTNKQTTLSGVMLDHTREICSQAPDNGFVITQPCFKAAGDGSRIDAEEFSKDSSSSSLYLGLEPMTEYKTVLETQSCELRKLWAHQ